MSVSGEPVRTAPEPFRVTPVQTTDLSCSDLDLSVTLTPERSADRRRRQVHFRVNPQHSTHAESDPVVVTVIPEPRNDQSAAGKPQNKETMESGAGRGRVTDGDSAVCGGLLTVGAEPNTTLALRAELRDTELEAFDREKAVKEKLQSSTITKNLISSRATGGLNFPRSQQLYRALVSVSLSHEQLISQALRDRPAPTPPTGSQSNKFSSQPIEAPDLQSFYSPDKLLRETPLLPGDHIPLPCPRPAPRPAHTTFHLHHLHKLWES